MNPKAKAKPKLTVTLISGASRTALFPEFKEAHESYKNVFEEFYLAHDLNDGYGMNIVEKQRALEAFLGSLDDEARDDYHDWIEKTGRTPLRLNTRYGRTKEVRMIGLDGVEVTKRAELRERSPTPEMRRDKFCGKVFKCDTCCTERCTLAKGHDASVECGCC